ncbi:elongation factor G [Gehongia tenuis]|uniref:TetM/TetW/TetO/TetS family tetracycline resistance ribosomal protection protein n=1 Tax=Gehongia tenuis TaxID=2763655 RepID=A0A926HQ18_9FIRM|nr:TetM/TetW/TetO/TetS family tetracycline resistance ribosomal protection protein [Gehongia tenuis]MBC8531768.1 TetM/TetW/TetO/TetS family tetracycline resistance ribosomal protection protein [Gehongia tenuis]
MIINIGILAHVDAGKTTLTESLSYKSGVILEPGSVDKGTTITDSMLLEKQRGITIQASVTSLKWRGVKVNIVDTPGHMDFLAEVQRSLAVLDGAVLVISAKDGVQAQTRILFHALRKLGIPTLLFINKIDQEGVDLSAVYEDIQEKLAPEIIVKQRVDLSVLAVAPSGDPARWDNVIAGDDDLLTRFERGETLSEAQLQRCEEQRFKSCTLFPVYHGSAKKNVGILALLDAIVLHFSVLASGGSSLCGSVFKIEYPEKGRRMAYLRLFSGRLHARDRIDWAGRREKFRISEMRVPQSGKILRSEAAEPGEIVILPSVPLKLNDVLGDPNLLPRTSQADPPPMVQARIEPARAQEREALLQALGEIADTDPLLRYDVDSITHEITLSFLGKVQMEILCALLLEKYGISVRLGRPTVIYKERPVAQAAHTIHIEVPPNPFWASIGLSIEPLPLGSGLVYESHVPTGYLQQSFQNAVRDGVRCGCEQGPCGWELTDCRICFQYALYYSAASTPADFRMLAPIVLEQTLRKAGTQLLEPYLSFTLYAPQPYMSRAYHDMRKYEGHIDTVLPRKHETVLIGEIPFRHIQQFREEFALCTNGLGVCLTELKGYRISKGEALCRPRRPNQRLDKTRHLFNKMDPWG